MTNFNIQVISDTICPWCYVGFRRLSRAITTHRAKYPGDTFNINWRAFYLDSSLPPFPGASKLEMYHAKFGKERYDMVFQRLSQIGNEEGIKFAKDGTVGSTRDSHRLMWYAGQQEAKTGGTGDSAPGVVGGVQSRVAENLFKAYFEDAKNITDLAVLTEAAVQAGFDREEIKKFLDSEDGGAEVDAEAKAASRKLVTGVPYYSIQGSFAVGGAEMPETFLDAFEQAKSAEKN